MKLTDYVTGIQHIGVPTNDIDKSKEFYQSIGFKLVYETTNPNNQPVAFLEAPGILIETYENKTAAMCRGAIDHVALNVEDIEAPFKLAKEQGFKFIESDEIVDLPFWENGVRYFLIQGPNMEVVEFLQKL